MKRNILRITAASLMVLVATLGSCVKGDKGDAGPAGNTGATGAQGATGATGATGAQGNANVNEILGTILPSNWGWNSTNLYNYADFTSVSQINSDIMATGMVLAFISASSPQTAWFALPYTAWSSPSITYQYVYELNFLEIQFSTTNQTNNPPANTIYVKIVVVASALRKAHPNTNWKDYNQVMQIVNESDTKMLKL